MADLRIGILGASRVAIYAMLAPARVVLGVQVSAIAARDPARAKAYAAEHGIPRVHASYADLIGDPEIDLVYISTPPNVHAVQALDVIAAGKPVLVEKPFSLTYSEARIVLDAAQAKGVQVFEAMHSPHHKLHQRLREIIDSGEIGKVRTLEAEFSVPIDRNDEEFRWRRELGGGALMDLGIYPLAWCRRIAGEPTGFESVTAEIVDGVDAHFAARLAFADGVVADIRSSMVPAQFGATLNIEGSAGRIAVANPLAPQMGHAITVEAGGQTRRETVEGPGTYEAQLIALRDTLVHGAPFPFAPDDFVKSMAAIELVRSGFRLEGH